MSLSPIFSIDTQHEDMIHDTQLDYYCKKLATCSSDRTVKIYDVSGEVYTQTAVLTGHEGPVWEVCWAHPKFGVILASCSYDGSALIYRETSPNVWQVIHKHTCHKASVNSIKWSPHEYGLILACASSDGDVSIVRHNIDDTWSISKFIASPLGCNAISWGPYNSLTSTTEDGRPALCLVTGSCDNRVALWRTADAKDPLNITSFEEVGKQPSSAPQEQENNNNNNSSSSSILPVVHSDWVRDVSWAPTTGNPCDMVASCGEDGRVAVYTYSLDQGGQWTVSFLAPDGNDGNDGNEQDENMGGNAPTFGAPVWRVSWSITGSVLAVSSGDHTVTLWKQLVEEQRWVQVSGMDESGVMKIEPPKPRVVEAPATTAAEPTVPAEPAAAPAPEQAEAQAPPPPMGGPPPPVAEAEAAPAPPMMAPPQPPQEQAPPQVQPLEQSQEQNQGQGPPPPAPVPGMADIGGAPPPTPVPDPASNPSPPMTGFAMYDFGGAPPPTEPVPMAAPMAAPMGMPPPAPAPAGDVFGSNASAGGNAPPPMQMPLPPS